MSLIVETDLKDILNRIDQKLDSVQRDVTDLKISVTELKGDIRILDERLSGQIKNLDERLSGQINTLDTKFEGLSTRIQNQLIDNTNSNFQTNANISYMEPIGKRNFIETSWRARKKRNRREV